MPSRQGTHLPHDSSARKFRKYLAMSTMQVSSSITIMPPEPIIEPALASSSKSTGRSRNASGMHSPGGTAGLDGLELLAARGCRRRCRRRSRRASSPWALRPGRCCSPCRPGRRSWCPCCSPVPMLVNQSAPLSMMSGTLAQVSTLFRLVGLSQMPLTGGAHVLGPGLADAALDGAHQGARFAADEGAGAAVDLDVEGEAGAEDVVARAGRSSRACSRAACRLLDGQRVLLADVDVALARRRSRRRR